MLMNPGNDTSFIRARLKKFAACMCAGLLGAAVLMPLQIQAQQPEEQEGYRLDSPSGTVTKDGDAVRYTFNDALEDEDLFDGTKYEPVEPFYLREDGTRVPAEEAIQPEFSVTEDPRAEVTSTTTLPYSAVCRLVMIFMDEKGEEYEYVGSGFVIGSDTILTCGHCVYDIEHKYGWVQRMTIEPAVHDSFQPYGKYDSSDIDYISVDEKWLTTGSEQYDNALIVLEDNIAQKTGKLKLSTAGTRAGLAHLVGYPAQYQNRPAGALMVEDWGGDLSMNGRCLESSVYGSGGQSGSPFLDHQNNVIGTFAYTYVFQNRSGGPVMDAERISWISAHSSLTDAIFRLYNPNSGEHFYTGDAKEVKGLVQLGWNDEGVAWHSSEEEGTIPVYRLYNPNVGDHHYTTSLHEYDYLASIGWVREGECWQAVNKTDYRPVHRLYNPNAKVGAHHFTMDGVEAEYLADNGWKYEGTAFYVEE